MKDPVDLQFSYKGHRVEVSHDVVPDEWLGFVDQVFTVTVDGTETVVPGIWQAFKMDGKHGLELLVKAYLDSAPSPLAGR